VDASGNIFAVGSFEGTVDFGGGPLLSAGWFDIFVVKFDPNGNHLWSQRFGDGSSQGARSAAIDGSGNVTVTGVFWGTADFGGGPLTAAGNGDVFLAKFDPTGNHIWSKRFGDPGTQEIARMATDLPGNVLVTGGFQGTIDFGGGPLVSAGDDDVFLAKFSPNGNHVWSRRFGGPEAQHGFCVAADISGNVFVAGSARGEVDFGGGVLVSEYDETDIVLAKFDPNANHLWSKLFGAGSGLAVATDGDENVILTGRFTRAVDFGGGALWSEGGGVDVFVAALDSNGNHCWSRGFGDWYGQYGYGVAVSSDNDIVVTGGFEGAVDFGGDVLTSAGHDDIFIAQFNATGNHSWSQRFGNWERQYGSSVAIDGSNNVVVVGTLTGATDFGAGPLVSAGEEDIFVAKFGASLTGVSNTFTAERPYVRANPNPFNPRTALTYYVPESGFASLQIYDVQGRLVNTLYSGTKQAGENVAVWDGVDTHGNSVASGIYFVRLQSPGETATTKIVLLK
jgi:hypothetical protein